MLSEAILSTDDRIAEKHSTRPQWPTKAIITAGMPYGNKGLHFGHVGGVFVPADVFARFLRDRIGEENVLFVCGTDCYGSPIAEEYRKRAEDDPTIGSIEDFVAGNHRRQFEALKGYGISLDIFEGSGIGVSGQVHLEVTDQIIERLYHNGHLRKLSTAQFYDEEAHTFLNGRQVVGHCPVQGCKSEKGYADECDLGHQYMPKDLLNPVSTVSGKPPVMREVSNWYFDLPAFRGLLQSYVDSRAREGATRTVVLKTIEEFLAPPLIYVKNEFLDAYKELKPQLPQHVFRPAEKGKASFELEFQDLASREDALSVLTGAGVRFRTGKTLVPFRITGNIAWGVPAPVLEEVRGLTVWCWPESLWAPLSFTRARIEHGVGTGAGERGVESLNPARKDTAGDAWQQYWCDPRARVYQFIGQDNIYFYGVAQTALWSALPAVSSAIDDQPSVAPVDPAPGELQQTQLIANYHLQFLGKKASSSGSIKPPLAIDLLDYYTAEQLRAHFIALGLGQKNVSFQPKPLNTEAPQNEGDPVLKEGTLLTNVLNRLARSCFYAAANDCGGRMPLTQIDDTLIKDTAVALQEYEDLMYRQEFHRVMQIADAYIRRANKYWADESKATAENPAARQNVIANAFYLLKAACLMMHPIAPWGTRMVYEYLAVPVQERELYSWEHAFDGFEGVLDEADKECGFHAVTELPPRTDFFKRHPSQF